MPQILNICTIKRGDLKAVEAPEKDSREGFSNQILEPDGVRLQKGDK